MIEISQTPQTEKLPAKPRRARQGLARQAARKLRRPSGATIVFAMAVFLIAAIFSMTLATSSLSNARNAFSMENAEQSSLAVTSAVRLLRGVVAQATETAAEPAAGPDTKEKYNFYPKIEQRTGDIRTLTVTRVWKYKTPVFPDYEIDTDGELEGYYPKDLETENPFLKLFQALVSEEADRNKTYSCDIGLTGTDAEKDKTTVQATVSLTYPEVPDNYDITVNVEREAGDFDATKVMFHCTVRSEAKNDWYEKIIYIPKLLEDGTLVFVPKITYEPYKRYEITTYQWEATEIQKNVVPRTQ